MTPYFEDQSCTIYHGDCREIAPSLGQFDACITDPPYGETSLDWDVWPKDWPALLLPLTRSLWCFGSFRMFWEQRDEFRDWTLAQDVIWEKQNGSGFTSDRFRRVHESAVQFYRGEWRSIHKEPILIPASPRPSEIIRRGTTPQHCGEIGDKSTYERGKPRLMRSVIQVANCHGYAVNETQKPEGIIAPLVKYSIPPGGRVLDLFAGSGTTLLVAKSQGKRAVGIEKRESQCQVAALRLQQGFLAL